eukprot:1739134-Rhodomonas_salina.1
MACLVPCSSKPDRTGWPGHQRRPPGHSVPQPRRVSATPAPSPAAICTAASLYWQAAGLGDSEPCLACSTTTATTTSNGAVTVWAWPGLQLDATHCRTGTQCCWTVTLPE